LPVAGSGQRTAAELKDQVTGSSPFEAGSAMLRSGLIRAYLLGAILVGGLFQSLLYSAYELVRLEFCSDNLIRLVAPDTYTVVAYERDMLPRGGLLDRVAQILGALHPDVRST
jgi:hypothetical protein